MIQEDSEADCPDPDDSEAEAERILEQLAEILFEKYHGK
jgi:hypothetical protein